MSSMSALFRGYHMIVFISALYQARASTSARDEVDGWCRPSVTSNLLKVGCSRISEKWIHNTTPQLRVWFSSTRQIPLPASSSRTDFVPAGGAGISLSLRLCTRLPGVRPPARLWPQRTSATALFKYISTCRSTHPAYFHRRTCLPGSCHICLEQSAGVSFLQ